MCKTLIVEDNAIFRLSLKEMLLSRFPSMAIEEAIDGREVMRKVDGCLPDLVFINVKLPNGNGLDIAKQIRAAHAGMVIAVFSNYDLPEYREAARVCGADHLFTKGSTTSDEIMACVEKVVARESARADESARLI